MVQLWPKSKTGPINWCDDIQTKTQTNIRTHTYIHTHKHTLTHIHSHTNKTDDDGDLVRRKNFCSPLDLFYPFLLVLFFSWILFCFIFSLNSIVFLLIPFPVLNNYFPINAGKREKKKRHDNKVLVIRIKWAKILAKTTK